MPRSMISVLMKLLGYMCCLLPTHWRLPNRVVFFLYCLLCELASSKTSQEVINMTGVSCLILAACGATSYFQALILEQLRQYCEWIETKKA